LAQAERRCCRRRVADWLRSDARAATGHPAWQPARSPRQPRTASRTRRAAGRAGPWHLEACPRAPTRPSCRAAASRRAVVAIRMPLAERSGRRRRGELRDFPVRTREYQRARPQRRARNSPPPPRARPSPTARCVDAAGTYPRSLCGKPSYPQLYPPEGTQPSTDSSTSHRIMRA